MSKISKKNIKKIEEDVLRIVFDAGLAGIFTFKIAEELARDDEFVLRILKGLEKNEIIRQVKKSGKGHEYYRKRKWVMTTNAYEKYKQLLGE